MNKELQNLLTDLENFIYQSEKDKFTLDVHQVHLILDHIANQGEKIEKQDNIINELEKWLDKKEKLTFNSWNKGIHEVQRKLQELKGSKNND